MSDWGMYELEDIVWDEFGACDDHIVPRPAGESAKESSGQGDRHKKPRREIVSSVGRSTDSRKPVTENVFQEKETVSVCTTLRDGKAPMLEKGSWSYTHDNGDSECINLVSGLTSEETKISDNCFKSSNADAVGNGFCTDDPILGNRGAAVDSSVCRFRLDDISPADSDLEFFGNEREDKESNNLLDYGWPDIGNFEDVDTMFRNCDSTFGQGNTSTANELSWFSASSHAIDSTEDAFNLDFRSSCSESNGLSTTPKHHEADMKFMPGTQSPQHGDCDTKNISDTFKSSYWTSDADDPASQGFGTYASWLDGEADKKGESASKEQLHGVNGGGTIKVSSMSQISNGSSVTGSQATDVANKQREKSKNVIQSSDEKGKDQSSGYLSGTSSQGPGLMQQFGKQKSPASISSAGQSFPSQQNQFPGPDFSSYLNTYSPYMNMEFGNPLHHFPPLLARSSMKSEMKNNVCLSYDVLTHASNNGHLVGGSLDPQSKLPVMTPEEKIEKLRQRQKIRSQLITGRQNEQLMSQTTITDQATVPKQLHRSHKEVGGDSEVEDTGMDLPAVESDSFTVQESSCMSSALPEDRSPEATSFRQLQDVMEQLDIRTKLCIRDSLYRLARSAEQRHNFSNTEGNTRKGRGRCGVASNNESNECVRFMVTETDTNPIDRSIAHLLFYRPSEPSQSLANDAMSLESHTVIHGPLTSRLLMPDQMVSQKDKADNTDGKLLSTDH